ncbi:hypothetical protein HDU92_008599 [Lobulomyces angularis]|nr:hypothetical protein HDU92_008599 [Lobulomyces angularis]
MKPMFSFQNDSKEQVYGGAFLGLPEDWKNAFNFDASENLIFLTFSDKFNCEEVTNENVNRIKIGGEFFYWDLKNLLNHKKNQKINGKELEDKIDFKYQQLEFQSFDSPFVDEENVFNNIFKFEIAETIKTENFSSVFKKDYFDKFTVDSLLDIEAL